MHARCFIVFIRGALDAKNNGFYDIELNSEIV